MKNYVYLLCIAMFAMLVVSCGKKEQKPVVQEEPKQEVYQPKHTSNTIDLKTAKRYDYRNAPQNAAAIRMDVNYDAKTPYAKDIVVKWYYANGDTHTTTIPKEFGLWANENGKLRLVPDGVIVWAQGQTKSGRLHEFVLYGDPKYNGTKVKPNSYKNPPKGVILHRK